jgi:hypothetical protein
MLNNEVVYNVKSSKLPNEEKFRNENPKRNDKKQNKLISNISKGMPNMMQQIIKSKKIQKIVKVIQKIMII